MKRNSKCKSKEKPDHSEEEENMDPDADLREEMDHIPVNMGKQRKSVVAEDSEEEMFAFDKSDEEDDDSNEVLEMGSDIEGAESGDDLPDVRAWGHKKKSYYHTDYIDKDFRGIAVAEEEVAALEEAEALNIQKRLAEQLNDADYSIDALTIGTKTKSHMLPTAIDEKKLFKEQIKMDLTKLSKKQKLELFHKESPEFAGLVEEFKNCIKKLKELQQVVCLCTGNKLPESPETAYFKTEYETLLNLCANLSFYLLAKVNCSPIQNHGVVRRIVQYRHLLVQLEQCISSDLRKKMISIACGLGETVSDIEVDVVKALRACISDKNVFQVDSESLLHSDAVDKMDGDYFEKSNSDAGSDSEEADAKDGEEKRAITYQIAKNKGLTPYRKKELRNPRVKHRMKYRKAKIRRKGQVREVRHEVSRYGGEFSGIKAAVSKSIKLK